MVHIFSTPYNVTENEEIVIQSSFENVNEQLGIYKSLTVDLASKEASGCALMGVIIFELAHAIQKQNSRFRLKVDYEYRIVSTGRSGPDYAVDVATIFFKGEGRTTIKRPVVLFEYKPQVPLDYKDMDAHHMCEVLIQGYYCVKNSIPIIHCLTDMSDWHYFRMEYNEVKDSLSIIWTHSFYIHTYIHIVQ